MLRANLALVEAGLVTLTWGNASAIDRGAGVMAIKPSGVPYAALEPGAISLVALGDGRVVGGAQPSSDTATHLELYRQFPAANGIAHTHSPEATAFAQAGRAIPCLGTTHADHFRGAIPVTRPLTPAEISGDYPLETGRVIARAFRECGVDPAEVPGVLVHAHGPFAWGASVECAVENAVALEFCARMAAATFRLDPGAGDIPAYLLDRHFRRKHGPGATYGQGSAGGVPPSRHDGVGGGATGV